MSETYHVLIVEDDFRIANIHQQYIEKNNAFTVDAAVKTGSEALAYLQHADRLPNLILLDVYIPDVEGLDLFWELRNTYRNTDILLVTAANEAEMVQEAIRGGVFDYIIKPADRKRFEVTLARYQAKRQLFASVETLSQEEIDAHLFSLPDFKQADESKLPKGIDAITLQEISERLKSEFTEGITAAELSEKIGTSRSTARRYLEYLVSIKKIETKLKYGTVGRPERKYFTRGTYEQNEQYMT